MHQLRKSKQEVPLSPLIDVVFLLLLFFIVTTTFQTKTIDVSTTQSDLGVTKRAADPLLVQISADNGFYIEKEKILSLSMLYITKRMPTDTLILIILQPHLEDGKSL